MSHQDFSVRALDMPEWTFLSRVSSCRGIQNLRQKILAVSLPDRVQENIDGGSCQVSKQPLGKGLCEPEWMCSKLHKENLHTDTLLLSQQILLFKYRQALLS